MWLCGVAPNVGTSVKLREIEASKMSSGKPRETVVAVQNAVAKETHGDRLVSARLCLGRITPRGSPPPTAPWHHLLTHTPPASKPQVLKVLLISPNIGKHLGLLLELFFGP